ncbi:MAG TPA: transcriptional repressor [Sphaerochaeta sp.]|nr:transcriptional repressor [Sphaerochaeta sp.]
MKERRQTIQKGLVLAAVQEAEDHPCAEEIYKSIATTHPSISRATVYRNLNVLVEEGKIRRIRVLGGPDHYDYHLDTHSHIQCTECGEVGDVKILTEVDINESTVDTHGYELSSFEVVFNGICPDCQKKRTEKQQ